jgi:serine/threonine-protein kinase
VVLDLLAAPPSEVPLEAQRELEGLERQHLASAMRDNALRMAAWLLAVPLPFVLGLREPAVVAAIGVLYAACLATAIVLVRWRITSSASRLGFCALTSVFVGSLSSLFGPFVIVPAVAAMNTVLFASQAKSRERPWLILFGALAIVVPLLLEVAGAVPPSTRFDGERILLESRVIEVKPLLTSAFLVIVSLLSVVTPTLLAGRLRQALLRAERDLVVQKWQLAQVTRRG